MPLHSAGQTLLCWRESSTEEVYLQLHKRFCCVPGATSIRVTLFFVAHRSLSVGKRAYFIDTFLVVKVGLCGHFCFERQDSLAPKSSKFPCLRCKMAVSYTCSMGLCIVLTVIFAQKRFLVGEICRALNEVRSLRTNHVSPLTSVLGWGVEALNGILRT